MKSIGDRKTFSFLSKFSSTTRLIVKNISGDKKKEIAFEADDTSQIKKKSPPVNLDPKIDEV